MAGSQEGMLQRLKPSRTTILVAPTVIWFALFLVLPILIIIFYSFLTYSSFDVLYQFSVGGWRSGVLQPSFLNTLVRTFAISTFVTLLCLVVGYPVAYYLRFYVGLTGGITILLFLVIPFWTAEMIRVIAWIPVLSKNGFVNTILMGLGIVDEPVRLLLFSRVSMVIAFLQNYVVFMLAPIYIALAQMDEGLIDASKTLRGDPVETFLNVTWPMSLPGVAIGCIFTFVLSMGNFLIPEFLGGGQAAVSSLIFLAYNTGLNYPVAAAGSITLLVVIFVVVFAVARVGNIAEIARG